MKRTPEKPTTQSPKDWYEWAKETAIAVELRIGQGFWCREEKSLPASCRQAITKGANDGRLIVSEAMK